MMAGYLGAVHLIIQMQPAEVTLDNEYGAFTARLTLIYIVVAVNQSFVCIIV